MHNPTNEYLATQVMTATPQKLHLMLIEAALRQCERTQQSWQNGNDGPAGDALSKAQEIVTEMLASLNFTHQPAISQRIASVYNFIFRALVTAQIRKDRPSLADAVRLLEIERETWRQIVQKASTETAPASHAAHTAHASHPVPAPSHWANQPTSSLSFEA